MAEKRYLIIGGGVAGTTAADTIRQLDPGGNRFGCAGETANPAQGKPPFAPEARLTRLEKDEIKLGFHRAAGGVFAAGTFSGDETG